MLQHIRFFYVLPFLSFTFLLFVLFLVLLVLRYSSNLSASSIDRKVSDSKQLFKVFYIKKKKKEKEKKKN